ncbi:helix-turn-helix domain-containing protein [Nocardioides maradonensis]
MSIEQDLRAVAEGVRRRIPDLVREIEREVGEQVPESHGKDDPVLSESERPSIVSALTSIVDGLAEGRRLPDRASDAALQEARVVAQAGIDLHALLKTYRIGQAIVWNAILEEAMRLVPDDTRRIAVLRQASDFHYAWNDRVTEGVVSTYQAEHNAYFFRSQDRRRRAIVSDLLRGVPTDADQLGYNLRTEHLAVVAWGRSPEANIRTIAQALEARHLTVSGTSGTVLGWLGGSNLARRVEEGGASFKALPETYLSLGEVAPGLEGFRLSHREAWQAYRVNRIRPREVVRYDEVSLEALVLRDRQAMQDFVARELRGIDEEDARNDRLRETLRAYFKTGQNAAAAANEIHVHERTIAYRLRSIEQRLGVSINARRDEIAVALRLADILSALSGGEDHAEDPIISLDLSNDAI